MVLIVAVALTGACTSTAPPTPIVDDQVRIELANGRETIAKTLLSAGESFANDSGLISEPVCDSPDIPERDLHCGRPTGSAMALVWARADYLKLRRSLRDAQLFDQPPQTVQPYLKEQTVSPRPALRFNHMLRSLPPGTILRIQLMAPAVLHWTADDWKTCQDLRTHDARLGFTWPIFQPSCYRRQADQIHVLLAGRGSLGR